MAKGWKMKGAEYDALAAESYEASKAARAGGHCEGLLLAAVMAEEMAKCEIHPPAYGALIEFAARLRAKADETESAAKYMEIGSPQQKGRPG